MKHKKQSNNKQLRLSHDLVVRIIDFDTNLFITTNPNQSRTKRFTTTMFHDERKCNLNTFRYCWLFCAHYSK